MSGALDGRRALVTGCCSGLGLGSARLPARDGAYVTIAGRTMANLQMALSALSS